MKKLFFSVLFYLAFFSVALADYQIISIPISPNGDVPTITVSCAVGHAYTEALYNNSLTGILGNYGLSGGISRKYCETGTISFDGWNMNTVLDSYNGVDNWTSYVHPPFKYVIIDTTNEDGCHSSSECAEYNLTGVWEGYSNDIYRPSNTCFDGAYGVTGANACTLAAGPIWTTVPYTRAWSDPRDDIPAPPPVGDPKNLPAEISATGDVPAVSINCIPGHDYTLSLVHEVGDVVDHSLGVVERVYCYPNIHNNIIAFSAFNLPTLLSKRVDASWWNYVSTPLEYIIKDTTGIYSCDDESCGMVNLDGAFNNYDHSVFLASSTYWTTVGSGPVFATKDNGLTWFDANSPSTNCVADCFSNVLFLPGIEASRLYSPSAFGSSENRLWEPDNDTDVTNLFLDQNGKSVSPDIYTKDVIDSAYGIIGIYGSFINTLKDLKSGGKISDYSFVPYDWRLSIDDILNGGTVTGSGDSEKISYTSTSADPYIISELRRLAKTSKSGKVTIVAHSNGGLVTKALLKKLADTNDPLLQKIDKVIFVAVPQLGTPEAIAAGLHGYEQDIPFKLSEHEAREFAENAPPTYNLLPSTDYFKYVDTPVVTFDQTLPDWISRYGDKGGNTIHSQELLNNFLTDTYERTPPTSDDIKTPVALNAGLLSTADALHSSLDTWPIPAGIKVTEIAGWGVPTTVSGINYTKDNGVIDPQMNTTIDGDGTVTTPSALWTNGDASVERYWVDEGQYNKDHPLTKVPIASEIFTRDHKSILEVSGLDNFISDIIINNVQTISNYSYLSNQVPVDIGKRLIYSLHSPLTLDFYDDLGNHTGISTSTGQVEEQIPGTYFVQFGDDKYIFTDTDRPVHIFMNGYANGTFTFNVDELQSDTEIASTTFQDIPTTSTTKVTLGATGDISTLTSMSVDADGDGKVDFTLVPVLGGIVTYTPPPPPPEAGGEGSCYDTARPSESFCEQSETKNPEGVQPQYGDASGAFAPSPSNGPPVSFQNIPIIYSTTTTGSLGIGTTTPNIEPVIELNQQKETTISSTTIQTVSTTSVKYNPPPQLQANVAVFASSTPQNKTTKPFIWVVTALILLAILYISMKNKNLIKNI
jgi:pimeloyl-ACP methyl ester carboxylesterase